MSVLFFLFFIVYWLFMLFYQCRSAKHYDGHVDMKDYTFCSNLIRTFPRWLIGLLFFNHRLVKLPLTIVVGQCVNYIFFAFFCICQYVLHWDSGFHDPLLKVWFYSLVALLVIMIVDHEIYCARRNK